MRDRIDTATHACNDIVQCTAGQRPVTCTRNIEGKTMLARRQQRTWPIIALLAAAVLAAGAAGNGSDSDESNESEDAPVKAGAAKGPGAGGGPPPPCDSTSVPV